MGDPKFWITDPYCASRGGEIVARNFKTAENAQRWLEKRIAEDPDSYVGCFVEQMPAPAPSPSTTRDQQEKQHD